MEMITRRDLKFSFIGAFAVVLLIGCAGLTYRVYGLDGVSYDNGKLTATEPKDDLPFSKCKPDEIAQPDGTIKVINKCSVIFIPELVRLKNDFDDCRARVKYLEKNCNPPSSETK